MAKHPFRFEKGDRVRHATFRRFVGIVHSPSPGMMVIWENPIPVGTSGAKVAPSCFPAVWEVEHNDDASK